MTEFKDRAEPRARLLGAVSELSALLKLVEDRAEALARAVDEMPGVKPEIGALVSDVRQTRQDLETLRTRAQSSN